LVQLISIIPQLNCSNHLMDTTPSCRSHSVAYRKK